MADLSFKIPNLNTQFTGQELINSIPDKLPMMGLPEPAAPPLDSGNMLSEISGSVGNIADALSPQTELNEKYLSRNKDIANEISRTTQISDTVGNVAGKFGPVGAIVGAGLGIGSALSKSATDEFGVVKDSGKAIVGGILNPIEGIGNLIGQKGRREARDKFINTEVRSKQAENQVAGNKITNSIPKYTPPSYGRFGRKLTKFTK